MLVASCMTRAVVTTEPSRSVESATRLMHDGRFRHLPVTCDGRLVGIISDRDVATQEGRKVGDVMHRDVIRVTPDTPIEVATELMLDNKIGALPVLENGTDTLVGIVSQTDLFAILARLLSGDGPSTRLEMRLDDLPRQLAQIASLAHFTNVPITSLVILPCASEHARTRTVVLRIGTIVAWPFAAELRRVGIELDMTESPGPAAADADG